MQAGVTGGVTEALGRASGDKEMKGKALDYIQSS